MYQGIAAFSTLAPGTLVDMDLVIQPDASLLATRVEVNDLAAATTTIGPFFTPAANPGQFIIQLLQGLGCTTYPSSLRCADFLQYDTHTAFAVSGQFGNLQNLPFAASFNSSSLFPGQSVSAFSSGVPVSQTSAFVAVTTLTLMPQTLTGTITGISNSGGFSVYTVTLAPYDLVPTLQGYVGPIVHLNTPNTVTVYADASTQLLTSSPITTGSVVRFRGLLFDDNGALRMDCAQINDGVPE